MMIINWAPITETETIPPLGTVLSTHLGGLHGIVKYASYSVWNLLYQTIQENGLPIGDVTFTDTGKPYLLDSSIYFSLSHSHGICAVAISDHLVGVDVEIIKTSYPPHLIERSLTDAEKAVYDGDFTLIWCRKEAVAKMTGEGISGYPVNIDTTNYTFDEKQIEWNGQKYWLVAVAD